MRERGKRMERERRERCGRKEERAVWKEREESGVEGKRRERCGRKEKRAVWKELGEGGREGRGGGVTY